MHSSCVPLEARPHETFQSVGSEICEYLRRVSSMKQLAYPKSKPRSYGTGVPHVAAAVDNFPKVQGSRVGGSKLKVGKLTRSHPKECR
jgi:hypothetical protein